MQAIGYVRVSTGRQVVDGVSVEVQRARIVQWCAMNGGELVEVYVDAGRSGGRADNRPALQASLAHACRTGGTLVTYSLSRLARSTRDAIGISERLHAAGAELVSLSERIDGTSAAGRMMFRMLAVLAEFERDLISERTATAMQHKRDRHQYTGGPPPYGWRVASDGISLEPAAPEQGLIRATRDLRADGLSLGKIGKRLTIDGRLPRCGGRWHAKTVNDLLMATVFDG